MSTTDFLENLKKFEPTLKIKSKMCKITGQEWEDTAQEVRRRLWEKKDQFDPQKASFNTWASHLADNCIKNLIRDSKTKKASYLNNALDIDELENE